MNKKYILTLALSFSFMLLSAVPALAGSWVSQTDDTWKYLDDNGKSVTGWIEDDSDTYYLDEEGYRKTGWNKFKGNWYHFEEDGCLTVDSWVDNYYVNSEGKWVKTK